MISILPFSKNQITQPKSEFKPYTTMPFRLKSQPRFDEVHFSSQKAVETNEVVFGKKKPKRLDFRFMNLPGIPCAYCGRPMVTPKEQKTFGVFTTSAVGVELQQGLLNMFAPKNTTLERNVAELFYETSKKMPNKNLQEISTALFPKAEKRLIGIQSQLLRKASRSLKLMMGDSKTLAAGYLDKTRATLRDNSYDMYFKRKTIIAEFMGLLEKEKATENTEPIKRALKYLLKLPTSGTSKDAFVVKYQRRESREIGERLLTPYVTSREHIHPESKKGVSSEENYLGTHAKCNHEREDLPFDKFIAKKPSIRLNIWENLSEIKKRIVNKEVSDPYDYLYNVSETINKESKGVIRLPFLDDIPRFRRKRKNK